MNLTTDTKALRAALALARSAVNTKSAMPILACVRLSTAEGLTLEASDLALRVRTKVDARVSEPGALAIDAKWLASALETCGAEVTLSVVKDKLRVKSGSRKVEAPWWPGDDFPAAPAEPAEWHRMPEAAQVTLARIAAHVAHDDARPWLCVVHLTGEHVDGTDGHRAARLALASEVRGSVPAALAAFAARLQGQLYLAHHEKRWHVQAGDTVASIGEAEGTFPDLAQVIPAPTQNRIRIPREALLDELRAALKVMATTPVRLDPRDGLTLHAQDQSGHDYTATVPCESSGKCLVGISASYLADACAALTTPDVDLAWDSELDPVLVQGGADLVVVMPTRLG